jgi:uncharacterized membrane protein YgcG
MKCKVSLIASSAMVLALAAVPSAQAGIGDVYASAPFQGITFTFTQTDADTLKFNIAGTLGGDWSTANYLGAFDLKDLGLNFGTTTAIMNGPGAVNLAGLNDQLSGANVLCTAPGSPPGGICFNISPDFNVNPMPMNLTYTIDFSDPLNITNSLGPHLQIAWLAGAGDTEKVGSLYSQNIGLSSSGGGGASSSGGGGASSSGTIPEPRSDSLAFVGFALLAGVIWMRRQA